MIAVKMKLFFLFYTRQGWSRLGSTNLLKSTSFVWVICQSCPPCTKWHTHTHWEVCGKMAVRNCPCFLKFYYYVTPIMEHPLPLPQFWMWTVSTVYSSFSTHFSHHFSFFLFFESSLFCFLSFFFIPFLFYSNYPHLFIFLYDFFSPSIL